MAHRRPLHPLEKWAYDAASLMPGTNGTKTNFLIDVSLMGIAMMDNRPDDLTLQLQRGLTQIVFAADCLSGRAQIVHIPDEVYDDVRESKLANNDEMDPHYSDYLPWPMFAIELNHCESQLAIVVSSIKYLQSRAKDAQQLLGIEGSRLEELTNMFYVEPDENGHTSTDTAIAFIPTPKRCRISAKALVKDMLEDAAKEISPVLETKAETRALSKLLKLDTMPYCPGGVINGDVPPLNELTNLITFVMSDNAERTTVYEPPKEPQGKPSKKKKRKQCQAHIYEMGVEWSRAYDAYRKAMKSNPQGGHKRPHTRRGHFHRFRVGPRDGEVRYVTHWLPPTLVGDISKYKPSNQGHIIG